MRVVTVLRSGGDYRPEHAERLRAQVEAQGIRFEVLGDAMFCDHYLETDWPGWWAKVELFKPGRFDGPVLYLDLDSTVVGPLRPLFRDEFTMLSDFNRPALPASGVMAWTGDAPRVVWDGFRPDPEGIMAAHRRWPSLGDQGWIARALKGPVPVPRFSGHVVSYKLHVAPAGGRVPEGTSVVAFHGSPRPWEVAELEPRE